MNKFWVLLAVVLGAVIANAAQLHMDFDTSPPQIALLFPKAGLFEINSDTSQVGFSFDVKNYTALANCTLFLKNDDNFAAVANKFDFENPEEYSIDAEVSLGKYAWKVLCYDIAGRSAESEARDLETIKQTMPVGGSGNNIFLVISIVIIVFLIFYVIFTSKSFKVYSVDRKKDDVRERLREKLSQLEAKQNEDKALSEL
jgi:cell division protein FtsL